MAHLSHSPRAPRADSIATRDRILDASERLFSERGYSGTSLRAIADDAEVNLAAAHYHFGSKEKLLQAAFVRCMAPINTERLRRLDLLESRAEAPTVVDIVRAFVEPGLPSGNRPKLPQLLAKLFAEPKTVSVPLLEHTFGPVASRFFSALQQALPGVSVDDLRWRFHFLVGAMVQLANFSEPINVFGPTSTRGARGAKSGLEHLVSFAVAGLSQGSASGGTA